jgi:hypothetical protein
MKYNILIGGVTLRMCTLIRIVPFSIDVKGGETYNYDKEDHTTRGSEDQRNTLTGGETQQ